MGENLWLVPSSLDLAAAELQLVGMVGREAVLRDKLRDDPPQVDYLLIDCPPSLGILTLNALAAVDEVFIPLQPHFLALHGLSKLLETIDLVAGRLNGRLKLSGVILCMYDAGTRLAAEVSQDVDDFFQNARGQADSLGRRAGLPDADPPQRASGRGPQFRQVDLPVRPRLARRRGLPEAGRGDCQSLRDMNSSRMYQNNSATEANRANAAATCWPMRYWCKTFDVW